MNKLSHKARVLFVFVIFLASTHELYSKVLIMTHCYNKPEYIKWQQLTFNKFLKDEYEFIVFDDTPNRPLSDQTQKLCQELEIECIRVPHHIHRKGRGTPSVECAETIQYMLETRGFPYPGIVVLIDSDMFLIRNFSVSDYIHGHEIAAHPQHRGKNPEMVTYFLPNLIFFNMNLLRDKETLDFGMGAVNGEAVDTGGFTHHYIQHHPGLKWIKTNCYYQFDENALPICDDF